MKPVHITIQVPSEEKYKRLIDRLLFLFLTHKAEFSPPNHFSVTVTCSHVQAERTLEDLLRDMQLHGDWSELPTPNSP